MAKPAKQDLKRRVIMGAREYGIKMVLFPSIVDAKMGVNVTEMECLGLLYNKGLAAPSVLARHTGYSSGATTAIIDRLKKTVGLP